MEVVVFSISFPINYNYLASGASRRHRAVGPVWCLTPSDKVNENEDKTQVTFSTQTIHLVVVWSHWVSFLTQTEQP